MYVLVNLWFNISINERLARGGVVMVGGEFPKEVRASALKEQMAHEKQRLDVDRQNLVEGVRSGEATTGDELHDQFIRWRGESVFDKRLLEFYEHVNDTIAGHNGEPFAISISDTTQGEPRGCFDAGEILDGFDYVVYGILDGESLRLNDRGLAIPAVNWVQSSAVVNMGMRSHSPNMGGYYAEHLKNQLEEAEPGAVPLMPFEQSGAVDKLHGPDFRIVAGNEQIEKALEGCQHMNPLNPELAISIAELHQQHDLRSPMPGTCKAALGMAKLRAERTLQGSEGTLNELRFKRQELEDKIDEIDDLIRGESTRKSQEGVWLQRVRAAEEFFSVDDHTSE